MAEITTYLDRTSASVIDESAPSSTFSPKGVSGSTYYADVSSGTGRVWLWPSFEALADQYKYKKLLSAQVIIPYMNSAAWISLAIPTSAPGAGRTWNDAMALSPKTFGWAYGDKLFLTPEYTTAGVPFTASEMSLAGKQLINAGSCFLFPSSSNVIRRLYMRYYGLEQMRVHVKLDTAVTITSVPAARGKASGYINPYIAQTFAWDLVPDGEYYCAGDWTQASATFYWSSDNGSTWNSVAASGSTQSVTLAANTLPVGNIQWKVTATDDQGTTATSAVYSVTTTDSLQTATPVSPIGTVEDGGEAIVLSWTSANDTGTTPTGADLQYSTDGSTWSTLATVSGSATSYSAAAGTIPGGQIYWRVRSYNLDSAAGSWSDAVTFVVVAAPPAPTVTVTAVPFAEISWQSSGQQAWKLTVDGTVYGPYFGTGKEFTLPDYLTDGSHTVSVEIQGAFGLWSQAGTATFQVTNVPGDAVALTGIFYRDAELSWTSDSTTADWLIYRDGVKIGHASTMGFSDRVVLGVHSWQVINRLAGGYYTASNIVEGELRSCKPALALLSGGEWLELRKSSNQNRSEDASLMRTVSVRHFAGLEWPEAEVSPYRTMQTSFDAAWLPSEAAEARSFEAMIGQTVIYKAPSGEAIVGILSAFSRSSTQFFRSYTCSVQRIHWKEYVDADA